MARDMGRSARWVIRAHWSRMAAFVVLSMLALAAVVSPPGTEVASAAIGCEEVQTRGEWTSITDLPGHHASGAAAGEGYSQDQGLGMAKGIHEWEVHPTDPNLFYLVVPDLSANDEVTPGLYEGSLLRSKDGGCSWEEILTDDDLNPALPGGEEDRCSPKRIESVGIGIDGKVYVAVFVPPDGRGCHDRGAGTTRFESLWVSPDGGDKWERVTDGLPVTIDGSAPVPVSDMEPGVAALGRFLALVTAVALR